MIQQSQSIHVVGAGGHGRVVVQLARACGYRVAGIIDDDEQLHGTEVLGIEVIGGIDQLSEETPAIIAIGDNQARERIAGLHQREWLRLIHPTAIVDETVVIGQGTVVMAGAIIQANAVLGQHVILNTGASVDHDCHLKDFSHICPGVILPGNITAGYSSLVGSRATAIPGVSIGDFAIVGAGSTVVHSVPDNQTVVGAPAKYVHHLNEEHQLSNKRVFLSPPHMSTSERTLMLDAFDSNWVAPLGPHVDAFEEEFSAVVGVDHAVALSSGTAALHLSLKILGVESGDDVITSSLTFAATANSIRYVGANPIFVDSNHTTWNLDPDLLADELEAANKRGRMPKAVVVVDIMGQCADYEPIEKVCRFYEVPIIEDAAESLGAAYHGRSAGQFGDIACFSFNGNKIITTSGGGMLVTKNKDYADRARYLATQARDPAPHYEHSEVGYNYRLSNVLAAIGRGQLARLNDLVAARRANFEAYQQALGELPGVEFMPEFEGSFCTRWLTCLTIDPEKAGATRENIRLALEAENIESRPMWKPMHLQPAYDGCRSVGGQVADKLFENGLCLPSGSSLRTRDRDRTISIFKSLCSSGVSASQSGLVR